MWATPPVRLFAGLALLALVSAVPPATQQPPDRDVELGQVSTGIQPPPPTPDPPAPSTTPRGHQLTPDAKLQYPAVHNNIVRAGASCIAGAIMCGVAVGHYHGSSALANTAASALAVPLPLYFNAQATNAASKIGQEQEKRIQRLQDGKDELHKQEQDHYQRTQHLSTEQGIDMKRAREKYTQSLPDHQKADRLREIGALEAHPWNPDDHKIDRPRAVKPSCLNCPPVRWLHDRKLKLNDAETAEQHHNEVRRVKAELMEEQVDANKRLHDRGYDATVGFKAPNPNKFDRTDPPGMRPPGQQQRMNRGDDSPTAAVRHALGRDIYLSDRRPPPERAGLRQRRPSGDLAGTSSTGSLTRANSLPNFRPHPPSSLPPSTLPEIRPAPKQPSVSQQRPTGPKKTRPPGRAGAESQGAGPSSSRPASAAVKDEGLASKIALLRQGQRRSSEGQTPPPRSLFQSPPNSRTPSPAKSGHSSDEGSKAPLLGRRKSTSSGKAVKVDQKAPTSPTTQYRGPLGRQPRPMQPPASPPKRVGPAEQQLLDAMGFPRSPSPPATRAPASPPGSPRAQPTPPASGGRASGLQRTGSGPLRRRFGVPSEQGSEARATPKPKPRVMRTL